MIRLKNKKGFTLIEVLLAVAIIGIVLGPIYILQGTVFDRVIRAAESVDRMLVAYDFFIYVKDGDEDMVKKNVSDPLTDLVYEKREPLKSSMLAKEFNHLFIKKVSWSWKYQDTPYSDALIDISFIPPEEKEESEQPKAEGQKIEPEKKPSSVAQKAMADSQDKKPQPAGIADQKAGDKKDAQKDILDKNTKVKQS